MHSPPQSFLIDIFGTEWEPNALTLDHFRRERNEPQKVLLTQLAGNRAKDACTTRIVTRGENDRSVLIKADVRTIGAAILFGNAHHDSVYDITLFHLPIWSSYFD